MTDCPPRLRGDLSKWLQEVNTGVYVGNVNSRVREAIWQRVCENLKNGRATMVFSANNEQRMDFRVHNTSWKPVDYEGIQLICRPLPSSVVEETLKPGFSKTAKHQMVNRKRRTSEKGEQSFVIIDLETTGLSPVQDKILEFGAIRVRGNQKVDTFSMSIRQEKGVPQTITALTGIDNVLVEREGQPLEEVLTDFLEFIGENLIVGYNLAFDMRFVQEACRTCGIHPPTNHCVDLLNLARRKVFDVPDYKLTTLVTRFSLDVSAPHRALNDCQILFSLYEKLNEKESFT
jgi:CRISPR-associated protein Cas2